MRCSCASWIDLTRIGYDPWNATKLALELQSEGVAMVEVRQGTPTLGEPAKFPERPVFGGQLDHGGHPVLRRMADNTPFQEHLLDVAVAERVAQVPGDRLGR